MIFIYVLLFCICFLLLYLIKKIEIIIDLIYSKFDIDFDFWGSDKNV